MDILKTHMPFLQAFQQMTNEQRSFVIRGSTKVQAKLIADIATNVVNKVLKVSDTDKIRLRRYKSFIRFIASQGTSHAERVKAIKSNPPAVIALVLATVGKLTRIIKPGQI
jgi:hypothetical protein